MGLSSGFRLGPYEIVALLGAGGMGEVYKARDTRLERTVAIKVLNSQLVANAESRARFEREAKVISQLQHPHICVLHDVGSDHGTEFLVMEFLEGESLADRLRKGPLAPDDVLKIGIQIADALEKAHHAGIVHRDLKPANVMLTKGGAKLLDFGLAKPAALGAAAEASASKSVFNAALTQASPAPSPGTPLSGAGSVVGTVLYMAPEQVQGLETDVRSDIFSFGVLLFEMITGRRAFQGKTQASIVGQILAVDPPAVSTIVMQSPPGLDRVVRFCLEKDPDERFQSAHDLKLQLELVQEIGHTPATIPSGGTLRIRRRLLWSAAVIALASALVIAGLRLLPKPEQPVVRSYILAPEGKSFVSGQLGGTWPSISPDGEKVAFSAGSPDGRSALWVRQLGSLESRQLPGTDGATLPFWSPDSRYLGFFADQKLKKIDTQGGPPQSLAEAPVGRGGSWGPDGTILFTPSANDVIWRVPAAGGTPEKVTTWDSKAGENSHRWPQLLPDGKHFLFFVRAGNEINGTYLGSLDAREPHRKILLGPTKTSFAPPGYLLFVRDGTLLAQRFDVQRYALSGEPQPIAQHVHAAMGIYAASFSASTDGKIAYQQGTAEDIGWGLVALDAPGKPQKPVVERAVVLWPSFSPDARKLAVQMNDAATGNGDIWTIDLGSGRRTRLTFDPSVDSSPVWSPDGTRIAFHTGRFSTGHIFEKRADGTGEEQPLFAGDVSDYPDSWSPDGRFLLFERQEGSAYNIWLWPNFGDRKPYPFLHNAFNKQRGQFSPDGKWVAYQSDESGRSEIYVVPFPDAKGRWQVSSSGGRQPRWRGDGKQLYFLSPENKLTMVDIKTTGDALESGAERVLTGLQPPAVTGALYDVSRDGKLFIGLKATPSLSSEPFVLIQNWIAEMKK
jgi:serine/threonine protein kinase